MAMQYVNGELVDDNQDQSNPLAGLNVAQTPNRHQAQMSPAFQAYEAPDWNKGIDTMGLNLDPNWMKQIGQAHNIDPGDWTAGIKKYNDDFSNIQASLPWWQEQSQKRAALSGINMLGKYQGFNPEQYLDRNVEQQQQKSVADAYHAAHDKPDGGLFGNSLFSALALGALGYFGLPALMGAGGAGAGAAAGGFSSIGAAAPLVEAGVLPAASYAASSAPSFLAGAGAVGGAGAGGGFDMLSGLDFSPYAGEGASAAAGGTNDFIPDFRELPGNLTELFNQANPILQDVLNTGQAETFLGPAADSNHNIIDALNQPFTRDPTSLDSLSNLDFSQYSNPEVVEGAKSGLDSSGWTSGETLPSGQQAPASIRDLSTSAGLQDTARLGLKGLKDMTNSPLFQVGKLGLNTWSQQQKANQLKSLMDLYQQKSDVFGPMRDMYMRSFTDPNFFRNMPEFNAGMDAFNQNYAAQAARSGGRSQLGGVAHNIAVDQARSRLAGGIRQGMAGPASQGPDQRAMATLASNYADANAARFNGLLDPKLWASLSSLWG